MFTKDEVYQINWIKDNLKTRKKWTKADYVDFYDRDIKLLLSLVEKVHASQPAVEADSKGCAHCSAIQNAGDKYCRNCGTERAAA